MRIAFPTGALLLRAASLCTPLRQICHRCPTVQNPAWRHNRPDVEVASKTLRMPQRTNARGIVAEAAWRLKLRRDKSNDDEFMKNALDVHVPNTECVAARLDWALAGAAPTVDLPPFLSPPYDAGWIGLDVHPTYTLGHAAQARWKTRSRDYGYSLQ